MLTGQRHWLLRSILSAQSQQMINALGISNSSALLQQADYYDALGVDKKSTQNEIKTAYYRLSMQYHPDKNKGSESAAKKFRQITQAYEVLGNYRLRRLYDKGVVHTAGHHAQHPDPDFEPEVEDDPETKFYKSRFRKSQVTNTEGRTPIYDFDEWSRAHYGKNFQRRMDARERYDRKEAQKTANVLSIQNEIILFGMVFVVVALYAIFYAESSYDTPKRRAEQAVRDQTEQNGNRKT